MNLILHLTLVFGFIAACNCSVEFGQVCLEESIAWRTFDQFVGDEINRSKLFESYFGLREKRLTEQRHQEGLQCPDEVDGEAVTVFDVERALSQLCIRERSLEAYSRVSNDGFIRKKIKKMVSSHRDFRNRLRKGAVCVESEVNIPEAKELSLKHKERFYESCKVEETYDYITRKIYKIIKDHQADLTPLDEAEAKLESASQLRGEFCIGSTSDCCGDDIVNEARNVAIVETAELLVKMAKGLVEPFKDEFNREKETNDWDDKFRKICLLERETSASLGKLYYRGAQEQTLKALHGMAIRDRTKLGRALNKQSCSVDNMELPPAVGPSARTKLVIGDRCEEEIKPKLMCQALTEAQADGDKYHRASLNNLQNSWCKKEERVLMAKDSVKKIYRPPVCSEQVVAAIKENAKTEIEILLQLLELEKTSERANELHKAIIKGTKNELKILQYSKKVLRMDIVDNLDVATRKQSLEAFTLISNELGKLDTGDEIKKSKLSSFLPPIWSSWFRL